MRTKICFNSNWFFQKDCPTPPVVISDRWELVQLPHSWNGIDGQDGDNFYFRGKCCYTKAFTKEELVQLSGHDTDSAFEHCFLEINGANASAEVYLNGHLLFQHDGGYSTFRTDLTDYLQDSNLLSVIVSNEKTDTVYPQNADFTFYGGLYRNVSLIFVPESHFDLEFWGSPGIKVLPVCKDGLWSVETEAFVKNAVPGQMLKTSILDAHRNEVISICNPVETTKQILPFAHPHLWNGKKDPYLYTAEISLLENDVILDQVSLRFGCRTFFIDPQKGFFLNGHSYPLHGVNRHQDRPGIGNALLPAHHEEDMKLILEMGANTIRLAHYQHDQYFYDLCDQYGMIVWAEIPYISIHMKNGRVNTLSQMQELLYQNYHHASIVVWGLSNEITGKDSNGCYGVDTPDDPDLIENHRLLNDLAHQIDPSRLTTLAAVSTCSIDANYIHMPDCVSYNLYFGWYEGDTSVNGPWLDHFHEKYPKQPIGLSEYGCEGLNWHSSAPVKGDYTEEYQAYYHEELIKQLFCRNYLWATHVWNMFDFGCDTRHEGGENGQNHKGLITIDRKYKKDAFYAYKAWLSEEPFVHICSKSYVDRTEDDTFVRVYSNLEEVTLYLNGEKFDTQKSADHFFRFRIPNTGETKIVAKVGICQDESHIRKAAVPNPRYVLSSDTTINNWLDTL